MSHSRSMTQAGPSPPLGTNSTRIQTREETLNHGFLVKATDATMYVLTGVLQSLPIVPIRKLADKVASNQNSEMIGSSNNNSCGGNPLTCPRRVGQWTLSTDCAPSRAPATRGRGAASPSTSTRATHPWRTSVSGAKRT